MRWSFIYSSQVLHVTRVPTFCNLLSPTWIFLTRISHIKDLHIGLISLATQNNNPSFINTTILHFCTILTLNYSGVYLKKTSYSPLASVITCIARSKTHSVSQLRWAARWLVQSYLVTASWHDLTGRNADWLKIISWSPRTALLISINSLTVNRPATEH